MKAVVPIAIVVALAGAGGAAFLYFNQPVDVYLVTWQDAPGSLPATAFFDDVFFQAPVELPDWPHDPATTGFGSLKWQVPWGSIDIQADPVIAPEAMEDFDANSHGQIRFTGIVLRLVAVHEGDNRTAQQDLIDTLRTVGIDADWNLTQSDGYRANTTLLRGQLAHVDLRGLVAAHGGFANATLSPSETDASTVPLFFVISSGRSHEWGDLSIEWVDQVRMGDRIIQDHAGLTQITVGGRALNEHGALMQARQIALAAGMAIPVGASVHLVESACDGSGPTGGTTGLCRNP